MTDIKPEHAAAVVGLATAAEVGTQLALDSTLVSLAAFGSVLGLGFLGWRLRSNGKHAEDAPSTESNDRPQLTTSPLDDIDWDALPELPAPSAASRSSEPGATALDLERIERRIDRIDLTPLARSDDVARASARIGTDLDATAARLDDALRLLRALDLAPLARDERLAQVARKIDELAPSLDTLHRRARGLAESAEVRDATARIERQLAPLATRDHVDEVHRDVRTAAAQLDARLAPLSAQLASSLQLLQAIDLTPLAQQAAVADLRDDVAKLARTVEQTRSHAAQAATRDDIEQIQARLDRRLSPLADDLAAARDAIRAIDLAPLARADAQAALGRQVDDVGARLQRALDDIAVSVASIDLAPLARASEVQRVGDSVDRAREQLAAIQARVARIDLTLLTRAEQLAPLAKAEALATVAARIEDAIAAVRALPAPEPVPIHAIADATRERLAPLVDALRDATLAAVRALPAPESAPSVHAIADAARERIEPLFAETLAAVRAIPTPERAPVHAIADAARERIAPLLDDVQAALSDAATKDALAAVAARVENTLAAVRALPAPEPTPVRAIADATSDRLAPLFAETLAAVRGIPSPEPAPVHAIADATRERIAPLFDDLRATSAATASSDALAAVAARLEETLAAVRAFPAPERAPVNAIADAARERVAPLLDDLHASLDAIDLTPLAKADALTAIAARIENTLAAVRALPAPERAPVHAIADATRERMAPLIDDLRASLDAIDLAPLAKADALAAIAARIENTLAAVRALPPPEPAPVHAIADATRERIAPLVAETLAAVRAIPAPERAPVHAIADATRERMAPVLDDLRASLDAIDLTPLAKADALAAAAARIEAAIAAVRALPPPEPTPVHTIADATRERIAPLLEALRDETLSAVRALPAPQPVPVHAIADAARERVAPLLDDLRASLDAIDITPLAKADALAETLAAVRAMPAPEPAPIQAIADATRERVATLFDDLRAGFDTIDLAPLAKADALAAATARVDEAVAAVRALPAPQPTPVHAIADATRERVAPLLDDLRASVDAIDLAPLATADALAAIAARLEDAVAAVRALPAPEPAPVHAIADAARDRAAPLFHELRARLDMIDVAVGELARHADVAGLATTDDVNAAEARLRRTLGETASRLTELRHEVAQAGASLRAAVPAPVDLSTLARADTLTDALAASEARLRDAIHEPSLRLSREVGALHAAIQALPRPDLAPLATGSALSDLASRTRADADALRAQLAEVRSAVAALPQPDLGPLTIGLDAVRAAVASVGAAVDALPRPDLSPLATREDLAALEREVATHADASCRIERAIADAQAGSDARRTDELIDVRDALLEALNAGADRSAHAAATASEQQTALMDGVSHALRESEARAATRADALSARLDAWQVAIGRAETTAHDDAVAMRASVDALAAEQRRALETVRVGVGQALGAIAARMNTFAAQIETLTQATAANSAAAATAASVAPTQRAPPDTALDALRATLVQRLDRDVSDSEARIDATLDDVMGALDAPAPDPARVLERVAGARAKLQALDARLAAMSQRVESALARR